MRRSLAALPLAASLLAAAAPALAATPAADLHLRYAVYIHGFRAVQVNATVHMDGSEYQVDLEDHTTGFVGAFIANHTTSRAEGRVARDGLRPVMFQSAGFSRGANRQTVIDYAAGNPVVRVLSPVEPARDKVSAPETAGTLDTLSAFASLLAEADHRGSCDATLRIFDGARLSLVTARTAGDETLPQVGRSPYAGAALRCDFTSREIAGFLHDGNYARSHEPQTGSAWVARIAPGLPPVPIRAQFSTLEHGPVAVYLVAAS